MIDWIGQTPPYLYELSIYFFVIFLIGYAYYLRVARSIERRTMSHRKPRKDDLQSPEKVINLSNEKRLKTRQVS